MCQSTATAYVHPWSDAGLPSGPYRVETIIAFPSPGLAEQNPAGYQNACRDAHDQARAMGLVGMLGTCRYCGMGLMNNVIIRAADGSRFVVGIDCAMKSGDGELMAEAQAAERKRRQINRRKAQEQAYETRRQARVAARQAEEQAQRDRNGGKTDAELQAEEQARDAAAAAEANGWLIDVLNGQPGGFCESMVSELYRFPLSRDTFRGRAIDIMRDIFAKSHGRRGSKAYDSAADLFDSRIV